MLYKKKWIAGISCTGLALGISSAVYAQSQEVTAEDKDTQVTSVQPATGDSPIKVGNMGSMTITASRQEENTLDVPASVTVINREQMDNHMVNSMQDLIRYQPGVKVNRQTSGTDPWGNLSGFTIRGVGDNRVQIQVDGARIIERAQDGNRDFVDLSTMKAVEVMKGPGSVLWGADALGGIVSYRTLDPDDLLKGNQFGGKVSTGFDSVNKGYTQTGMLAVQFSETFQGLLAYTHRKYSETRLRRAQADGGLWDCSRIRLGCGRLNPLSADSDNVLAKLVWRPNADHEIKLTGEYFRSDADVLQLYDKDISSKMMTTTTINNGDYRRNQKQTRQRIALEHDWDVNASWLDNLKWKVAYSPQKRVLDNSRQQQKITKVKKVDKVTDYMTYDKMDYSEDFLQADIQLTSSFNLGSTAHTLTYGFQGDITKSRYWRKTTTDDMTNNKTTVVYGGGSNFSNAKTTRADLYLQDEIKLFSERLILTPGLRWANYKIDPSPDNHYTIIEGKEPKKLDSSRLIPQLGMMIKLNNEYSLYGRYAEGFKMPTSQQLFTSFSSATSNLIPNPDLKPEKVRSAEAGVRGQFEKGWFSAGVFQSNYTNFIKSMQFVESSEKDYTSLNVDKVKLWGIEVAGEWRVAPSWTLNGAFTYQYGQEWDKTNSRYVPFNGESPLTATMGVKWEKPSWGLDVELAGTFVEGISRTTKKTQYKPGGYALFDTYLNWQINDTFRLSAAVLNIFDKRYFNSNATSLDMVPASAAVNRTNPLELYTGPGRSFKVNLTAEF